MRLIDADTLKPSHIVASTTANSLCHLYVSLEDINNAPTIEAEPVRRGRWIGRRSLQVDEDDFEIAKCSECGEEVILYQWQDLFCPNCGADMRGE